MKALLLALVLISSIAKAGPPSIPPGSIPGHDQIPPRIPNDPDDNGGWQTGGGRGTSCAPEVVEGNINATERTLKVLASSSDFADATQFRSLVTHIASVQSADSKVSKYFALIGIDSRDHAAVADFVGARDVRSAWITSLEHSTALNADQSAAVAAALQNALRGNLQ